MRVKLLGRLANARGNWSAGELVTVSEAEGQALVACKAAVALQDPPVARTLVPESKEPETATLEAKESAVLPRGRGRRRGSSEE